MLSRQKFYQGDTQLWFYMYNYHICGEFVPEFDQYIFGCVLTVPDVSVIFTYDSYFFISRLPTLFALTSYKQIWPDQIMVGSNGAAKMLVSISLNSCRVMQSVLGEDFLSYWMNNLLIPLIFVLPGVNQSSQNSMDKWAKQILHVWAMSYEIAHVTVRAYEHIAPDLAGNTIVLITVASNAKEIFQNTWNKKT